MNDFIDHLHDLFATFGPVRTRPMFGGHGLYHGSALIGVVMGDALYLKADRQSQAQFEAAGSAPFVYTSIKNPGQQRTITMSYWSLPEDAMDSPQAMLPWARLAYAAALRKVQSPNKRVGAKRTSKTITPKS